MTTNHAKRRTTKVLLYSILVASAAALLVAGTRADNVPAAEPAPAAPARQIIRPWTGVGSTAIIDESSLGAFAFSGPSLGFLAGSPANSISARFNVTNTFDNNANPNAPGWTVLELGSFAPATTNVSAVLIEVDRCTGAQIVLCSTANNGLGGPLCTSCNFGIPVDFTSNLYYIEVRLTRPAGFRT
jgi:hypothetical protein